MRRLFITLLLGPWIGLAAGQIPTSTIPEGLGFNIHFTDEVSGEVEQIAATGAKLIRMDFSWIDVEKSAGEYNFDAYDRLMLALDRHKIRPIFILDYAHPLYDDNRSPDTDAGRAAFARFAAAGAKYFRGRGVIWEIYNEPNIAPFWRPTPNVADYIKLAQVTIKAIREVDPAATIIGPACSGIDLDFLRACADAGLLKEFAGVSVHPYTQRGPENAADGYGALRRLLNVEGEAPAEPNDKLRQPANGSAGASPSTCILSGEWGYSDIWAGMDRRKQAAMLARQWLFNYAQGVPISIWYDWRDDGLKEDEPEHHFGVVEHEAQPIPPPFKEKPAYIAAKTLIGHLDGFRFNKRIWSGAEEDWFLLFSRGDETRIVAWTTSPRERRAFVPGNRGDFGVIDMLGQQRDKLDGYQDRIWLDLVGEPVYVVPDKPNDALRLAAAWSPAPAAIDVRLDSPRGKVRWISNVTNPLSEPAGVLVTTTPPPADAVESHHKTLAPGESATFEIGVPIARRPGLQFADVYLCIGGFPHPIAQRLTIECVNPIRVELRPITRNDVQLFVAAPPGESFTGQLTIESEFVDAPQKIDVKLDQAAREFTTLIKLQDSGPDRPQLAASLSEAGESTPLAQAKFTDVSMNHRDWQTLVEGDEKVAAEHKIAFAPAPAGLGAPVDAAQIDYRFDAGWRYVMMQARPMMSPAIDRASTLGLWVKGDGSGNILRCRFVDSADQTFQPDGPRLNFTDWRYITFPLDGTKAGHWGGDKSGIVQFPIRLETLVLIDSASRQKTGGTVFVAGACIIEHD